MPAYKYKTKSGEVKWYTSFWYSDWAGNRRRKKKEGFSLKREADEYEKEFIHKAHGKCDMAFSSMVDLYQSDMDARIRDGTAIGRDSIIETWLLPYFGQKPVNQITPAMVRKWQTQLMAKTKKDGTKYSESYLHGIHVRLSAIFNFAVTFYGLPSNPCTVAGSIGCGSARRLKFWTLEQYTRFIEGVEAPGLHVLFQLLYWTGIRIGECLALSPSDFLPTKQVHIDKTYKRLRGQDIIGPPKTKNSYRDVSLPDFLYDEVLTYIGRLYEIGPHDRIFQFSKSRVELELKRVAAATNLPSINIHGFRHSHASLMANLGYTITDVADRLGDSPETTSRTYIHLFPERKKDVATSLNSLSAGLPSVEALLTPSEDSALLQK